METSERRELSKGRGPVWLTHLVGVVLLGGVFAYGASIYDSLPDSVPTHWGGSGRPDAWEDKSFGSVYLPLMMGAGVSLLLALLSAAAPAMVQENENASPWELYRREGMIRGTVAALGATSFLMAVVIGYLTLAGWTTPDRAPIWPALAATGAVLVALTCAFAAATRWARRAAEREGVYPSAEENAEDSKWVAGILYNDADDPHVLVSKRQGTGTGMTVNVGNRRGRAVVVIFLLLFVGLPLGLGVFALL
ncbi:DUF1648 domain-containing protein [Arthrobacter sp. Sa2BUA2]|uniref:DUF1648 domain-containing protein n=1 Tax=Arthrobacter pullicola TaxID=2762224 RepID=A0ABR8YMG4_9MICC|nr:DUF1648 domain-containing protein [Arthrobacter pullicola]MBD8045410.1 DUF1648 domain-containing protein [Arthrobacter pullicola]